MSVAIPVFEDKFANGWPEHAEGDPAKYTPLATAMLDWHRTDAHFATYSVPDIERRLATEMVFAETDVRMTLFVIDVEPAGHAPVTPEWWDAEHEKICRLRRDHRGAFAYRTRGGYRVVYQLAKPFVLQSTTDAERWKRTYLAWLDYVSNGYGIVGDRACQDWTRLYRLPRVVRDGKRQDLEVIGDPSAIGTWDVEVAIAEPEPPKPRSSTYTAIPGAFDIRDCLVSSYPGTQPKSSAGAERWDIECPWKHEHSMDSGKRQTSVFVFASGAYEFKCLHTHCLGRDHEDFRKFHQPDWDPMRHNTHTHDGGAYGATDSTSTVPSAETLSSKEWSYGPSLAGWLGDTEPDEDDSGDWDIRGLVAKHVPSFLAGDPKVGKTMIMESWGIALATGVGDWCGFPVYGRKRTLLMPREDGLRTTKIRLWQLARGAGLSRPHELDEWLSVDPTSPLNLENKEHITRLRAACERFDVIMIDSFTTAHLGDENSAKDIARAMEPVRDLAIGTKTSIVLVHHYNGKGNADDKRGVKHRLRGSSALAGYARHILGVSHGPKRGQLEIASDGNLEYQIEPTVVALVPGENQSGKRTLGYELIGSAANAVAEAARGEVVAAVETAEDGLSANGIYKHVGGNRKAVLAAVRMELEPGGSLVKQGKRIYSRRMVPGTSGNHLEPSTGTGSAPYRGAPEPAEAWWEK